MKYWIAITLMVMVVSQASADSCDYIAPRTVDLPYHKGAYMPVYFSTYQFDLPSQPDALLSGDGFIASYPGRGYIGQQHVDPEPWGDQLKKFTSRPVSVTEFYRLIYGISTTKGLDAAEHDEVRRQRSILKLDCNANVTVYRVGGAVDVVSQASRTEAGFHTLLLLSDEGVELITLRRPMQDIMQVIASIKRRR